MVEKHFTLSRDLVGPDHWFSSTPDEFQELVRRVRQVEKMLGSGQLCPTQSEVASRQSFRLSCTASRDLEQGTVLQNEDICFRRPATGLPPKSVDLIVGKTVNQFKLKGAPLNLSDFDA